MIVVDSSTLISLARSGNVDLLLESPLGVVIPDVAWQETVEVGRAAGDDDARVVEERLSHLERRASASDGDAGVLEVARGSDGLVCDDIVLGRRARSLGVRWLRTPDLVLLLVRCGRISRSRGQGAITALREAGRLHEANALSYLKELG
ncbi:MAG: hypothetical protein AB1416_01655 [Actinomycetota bacterium]